MATFTKAVKTQQKLRLALVGPSGSGKTYTANVVTDTSVNFIQLGFYADKTFDNNFNEGYTIQLWGSDKICMGSYASLSSFNTNGCE